MVFEDNKLDNNKTSYPLLNRIWNSPTLMTWLSYSTKAVSLFGVLPLILKKFSAGDIVLWYLFFTIVALQSIVDFGFRMTFSRLISYAFGGASQDSVFNPSNKLHPSENDKPNMSFLTDIISNMKYIYVWLTVALFILMAIFGTWSMIKPIGDSSNITSSWYAWAIVLFVSCISFYGKIYMNFLEGIFQIAMVRRIETLTSLGAIFSSILVMVWAPNILNMIIANQVWVLVVMFRDWYMCKKVNGGLYVSVSKKIHYNKDIFLKIWQPAWRTGLAGFVTLGATNLTSLVYAQFGNTSDVAAYLLALRVISQIRDISMAPFYSKIPLMSMYRVKHDINAFVKLVTRSMFLSHVVFVVGVVVTGIFFNPLLALLGTEVSSIPQLLWILIGFAFWIHRFGAMHMQAYLTTNHIIAHIADGVSGVLYIVSSFILSNYIGVYAIPVGMLIGYLGFYAWYAAKYSYQSMGVNFIKFEIRTSLIPLAIFAVYIIFVILTA